MRWSLAVLLLSLLVAPSEGRRPRVVVQSAPREIELVAAGENGSSTVVDGMVCDNLRETPTEDRDRLEVRLPDAPTEQIVAAEVRNADGSAADRDDRGNAGTAVAESGRLYYYPPDEYNRVQQPRSLRDVDGPATRIVLLTVRLRAGDGTVRTVGPRRIVLARPPVVLIHGINRGPDCWNPMTRAYARRRGRGGPLEIPASTLDHFAPIGYEGIDFRDQIRYPSYLFYGSGPVELGAALLERHIDEVRRRVLAGDPLPAVDFGRTDRAPKPFQYLLRGGAGARRVRLAIRRVDLIGWSYGGVIARWYLAARAHASVPQYVDRYVLPGRDGRPLELQPPVAYRHDVRKLITLGSMWRGVPLVNCLNEIRFSTPSDPRSLAHAPIRLPQWVPRNLWEEIGAERNLGSFTHALDIFIRIRTPAMEVMAIDSPWMDTLIYGTPDPGPDAQAAPFRDDVAYGSVAGDNSAYLSFGPASNISPYGALAYFQQPSRFPYLALDRRSGLTRALSPVVGDTGDYTDGIVPIWSALIPGNVPGAAIIVPAAHDNYFANRETLDYTTVWLNNAALPTGRVLNPAWDTAVQSRGGRKRWVFRKEAMAPAGWETVYGRIGSVGRILPAALYPARSLTTRHIAAGAVRVEWPTPAGGQLRRVTLYTARQDAASPPRLTRLREILPTEGSEPPSAIVNGLSPDTAYYIVAEAAAPNHPDAPIIVKSEPIRVER